MENMNAEKNAGRKKLLVPLVVLIMCGVALTGAAYAYSATVTVQNNTVQGDFYSIDMYSDAAGNTNITGPLTAGSDFKVYTTKTVGAGAKYNANVEAGTFTRSVYVKVETDIVGATFNLSATCVYTPPSPAVGTFTITAGDPVIKSSDGAQTITNAVAAGVYKVEVTFTVTAGTFGSYDTVTALQNAIDNFTGKFNLTVNAERVGSATPSP